MASVTPRSLPVSQPSARISIAFRASCARSLSLAAKNTLSQSTVSPHGGGWLLHEVGWVPKQGSPRMVAAGASTSTGPARSCSAELVQSVRSLGWLPAETRNARSSGESIRENNSNTARWCGVAMQHPTTPTVSGRSISCQRYFTFWGTPSSSMMKSSLRRSCTAPPLASVTTQGTRTRLTSAWKRGGSCANSGTEHTRTPQGHLIAKTGASVKPCSRITRTERVDKKRALYEKASAIHFRPLSLRHRSFASRVDATQERANVNDVSQKRSLTPRYRHISVAP